MSRICAKNTKPEIAVRSLLHGLGYRFRLSSSEKVFGKPDIVLPKLRVAVFVHGCFWHRHTGCKYSYTPKSRVEFWSQKFAANVERDRVVIRNLRNQGWRPVIVWECELRNPRDLEKRLKRIIVEPKTEPEIES